MSDDFVVQSGAQLGGTHSTCRGRLRELPSSRNGSGVIGQLINVTDRPGLGSRAFEDVYRAHCGHVLAYGLRRTTRANAEDMAASTWLIAWRRRGEVRGDPLPWLLGIARRVLANQLRSARRAGALHARIGASLNSNGQVPVPEAMGDSAVSIALAALSERDREVLLLIAWDDLSSPQAAAVLGCTSTALRVRLHRARKRFADSLAQAESADVPAPKRSSVVGGAEG
jgi:RNA polymerase sigma-70 factor (ECF subfamily)